MFKIFAMLFATGALVFNCLTFVMIASGWVGLLAIAMVASVLMVVAYSVQEDFERGESKS